ncbi:hypothetical protein M378DRAFT_1011114 [Amanita muscaria Koide BX008]|uniref:Uncharacterized protein n=1 Tax=Amanita muscaria (strain Koide BX008) TaxID=946122 RepID=A0A0C2SZ43_AMAMK|nr:hypothetical protein M378DRAFT_1011114 [Amanita muscaria Koide BX008]
MSSTRSLSSTSTHNSIAFLRVPKSGFGGKAKTQSKNKTKSGQAGEEEKEEWYIPYKGPYEPAPAATTKRSRSRDSWGDPVPGVKSGVGDGDGVDSHQGGVDERRRSGEFIRTFKSSQLRVVAVLRASYFSKNTY